MKIHHVGYAVRSMEASRALFAGLGYREESELVADASRQANILFLIKDGYRVELIAPTADSSDVSNLLSKIGDTPYHICYEVPDLPGQIEALRLQKFVIADPPAPAVAFGGRRVAFLYKAGVGLIELVESESAA